MKNVLFNINKHNRCFLMIIIILLCECLVFYIFRIILFIIKILLTSIMFFSSFNYFSIHKTFKNKQVYWSHSQFFKQLLFTIDWNKTFLTFYYILYIKNIFKEIGISFYVILKSKKDISKRIKWSQFRPF